MCLPFYNRFMRTDRLFHGRAADEEALFKIISDEESSVQGIAGGSGVLKDRGKRRTIQSFSGNRVDNSFA